MGIRILALGTDAQARRAYHEALRIATDFQGTPVALEALAAFASLQAKQGDLEHPLELLFIVLDHPAIYKRPRSVPEICEPTWKRDLLQHRSRRSKLTLEKKPSRWLGKTYSSNTDPERCSKVCQTALV